MTDPRDARLRRLYDISSTDYDTMLATQGGVCYICQRPPGRTRLAVDHDHRTGKIRGLLCMMPCNRGLREWMTAAWLERALDYLLNPPVVAALGRQPQGVVGRVTNKRRRRKRA